VAANGIVAFPSLRGLRHPGCGGARLIDRDCLYRRGTGV
jgi:hypothetical protein